jgi:tetratricopeptide (TPR) repeat protein
MSLRLELARSQAAILWDELQRCNPGQRRLLVERTLEFQTWALAERLTEESVRAAPKSAALSLELARLAVRVAQLAPGDSPWRSRLEGYARAFVANALRVEGSLAEAEAEWLDVRRLWQAGAGGDPTGVLPEWRLFDLEASLRCNTRQFETALELLDRAAAAAPPQAIASILLNRSLTLEQAGDISGAVSALSSAAPLLTPDGDPRLPLVLGFNLVVNLCHLNRFAEAEVRLPGLRQLAVELDNPLDLLHVRWLSGRVAAGLGRQAEACLILEEVRDEYASRRACFGTARVSLELAGLYLEQGRSAAVRELAGTMAWILAAQGLERDALHALRLFCEAARQEIATLDQVRRVVAVLDQAAKGHHQRP